MYISLLWNGDVSVVYACDGFICEYGYIYVSTFFFSVKSNLYFLTWVGDNFWAGSSRRRHKPTVNFHECRDFVVCVEGDEWQAMKWGVLPSIPHTNTVFPLFLSFAPLSIDLYLQEKRNPISKHLSHLYICLQSWKLLTLRKEKVGNYWYLTPPSSSSPPGLYL